MSASQVEGAGSIPVSRSPLSSSFYNRSPLLVAPDLLGKVLVRRLDDQLISGRIVEVEAYLGFADEASHSFRGKTKRNLSLFKRAGHAYVHSIHTQNCLDVVVEEVDVPSGVLIRALEPLSGIELMQKFRGKLQLRELTSGPGKLTQALQIPKEFDGVDLTDGHSPLFIVDDDFQVGEVTTGKRIGISKATEHEYRFYLKDNPYVSR